MFGLDALNGRSPAIRQKFRDVDLTLFICSIVKSELAYGAFKSLNPDTAEFGRVAGLKIEDWEMTN